MILEYKLAYSAGFILVYTNPLAIASAIVDDL
jgi:hypothetical protein